LSQGSRAMALMFGSSTASPSPKPWWNAWPSEQSLPQESSWTLQSSPRTTALGAAPSAQKTRRWAASSSYTQLEKRPVSRQLSWFRPKAPAQEPVALLSRERRGELRSVAAALAPVLIGSLALILAGIAWTHLARRERGLAGGKPDLLKAVGYAPIPLRSPGHAIRDDDFASSNTSALWGPHGRRDLRIIRSLGANAVRLYGNDFLLDHSAFLDEARAEGLRVIPGISDWPYTQMEGSCKHTKYDCFQQIKDAYGGNLQRGFLGENGQYHPAIHTVALINEPDLKVSNDSGVVAHPSVFCKAIISAFDAVLEAEKEAAVVGPLPNFTATFSYGVCYSCKNITREVPAFGQMVALREAMRNPESVGYTPRNDLWDAYQQRFTNSVNTENPADEYKRYFQDRYDAHFQGTPVFIGEYHAPLWDQREDLPKIMDLSTDNSSLLFGVAFFEFQVRYDKGGVGEMSFGMFGLGDHELGHLYIKNDKMTVYCLKPIRGHAGEVLHVALAKALNGTGVPRERLCPDTPLEEIQQA